MTTTTYLFYILCVQAGQPVSETEQSWNLPASSLLFFHNRMECDK